MIDNFNRKISYLRLSVTELCNLRCRYCMGAEGVCKKEHAMMLTEEEMILAVRASVSLGITKVRITGGEPLVKKNIVSICEKVSEIPGIRELCLTTNGILLPRMAKDLKAAGVDRLNLSLDTLNEEKYRYITRIGNVNEALEGLFAALEAGFEKIKINAVLIGGFNEEEIPDLAALTLKYPVDMRFIELMPMKGNDRFGPEAYIPGRRVLEVLPGLTEVTEQYAEKGSVARLYRLPEAMGNVGLISPLSSHFCKDCNRIRITADGKVKPCLHTDIEFPLKGLSEEEMRKQIASAILAKPEWHGELSHRDKSRTHRAMNQIGG